MKQVNVAIPANYAEVIDKLVKSGEYSSRNEFVREATRTMLLSRNLLKVAENGAPEEVPA